MLSGRNLISLSGVHRGKLVGLATCVAWPVLTLWSNWLSVIPDWLNLFFGGAQPRNFNGRLKNTCRYPICALKADMNNLISHRCILGATSPGRSSATRAAARL